MKNMLFCSVAVIALSVPAFAADLPSRAAPVLAPAPVFTFAGGYIGFSAGYINKKTTAVEDLAFEGTPDASATGSGGVAGVTIGYNFQNGAFVYGIEADFSVANTAVEKTVGNDNYLRTQLNSFGTLRARVGFAIQPRTMIYATGGLAFANVQSAYSMDTDSDNCRSGFSGMKTGWAVGGGIEHALSNNLTVKVEGLYFSLGNKSGSVYYGDDGDCRASFKKNNGAVARVGLNYKF